MAETTLDNVPRKVRDLFNKGFSAFERGNLDYAIDLLSSCVQQEPGLMQARKFLRAAEIQKFKSRKNSNLTHALATLAGLPKLLGAMGALNSGKPDKALASAEELLRKDPLNPRFIKIFTQAAINSNLPEVGIQTLEVARDHNPEDIWIINMLGALYLKVGRTRSARECFEALCEISPNDAAATKLLKDAMALDSMHTDGWSEAASSGGSFRDIIKDEKEALTLEKEAKAVKTDKDVDVLIADMQAKIAAEPGNVNYYRALSRHYIQKNMFDEAIGILQKALELNPGDPELDNAVSMTKVKHYDYRISELRKAGDTAGVDVVEAEKRQFVFDDLQDRVARYPNDLKLRFDWGVMLFQNDYVNEAIQQFQLSQRSPQNRVSSLFYMGLCFKMKKQYDMAMDQLEQASAEIFSMDATKKEILYELGQVSEATGDMAKATSYYKQIYQVDISYRDVSAKIEHLYNRGAGG